MMFNWRSFIYFVLILLSVGCVANPRDDIYRTPTCCPENPATAVAATATMEADDWRAKRLTAREIALERIEEARRTNATTLNLAGIRYLNAIPAEIGELTQLETLYAGHNSIQSLPPEIGQLTNLKYLSLQYTHGLQSLPHEFGQLRNLEYLDLTNTRLPELPPEIGQLANLQELILTTTDFTYLPPEIGQLGNLQILTVGRNNNLTHLPPEIGQLVNLRKLTITGNENLTELPIELTMLTNLEELQVTGQARSHLPPDMVNLPNLRKLTIAGFPTIVSQFRYLEELSLVGNVHIPPDIKISRYAQSVSK